MDKHEGETQKKNENFEYLNTLLSRQCVAGDGPALPAVYLFISHKWTLLVLGALLHGTKRTSELQRNIEGISQKMLTGTLKKLTDFKMVERKVYPIVPPKVEYTLTEFGKSTAEPVLAMLKWSNEWKCELDYINTIIKQ